MWESDQKKKKKQNHKAEEDRECGKNHRKPES